MYKVALIGAGGMAGMHGRCYTALPNAQVVGVYDIRPEAAAGLADICGATPYDDPHKMLAATRPDIIDVCTPTPWHAEYVEMAAGYKPRGIVVEKPMGRTIADCDRIIGATQAAGVPLFVAQVLRFFPEFSTARAQVLAGAVGDVVAVRTRRGGPFPRAWENWYGKVDLSGGLVLDLIIHDFDWLRWTFGEVERVYAQGLVGDQPAGLEVERDYALVTLRFKSGAIGHVEGTWADPGGFKVTFEIAGTEGLLESNFNQPSSSPFVAAVAGPAGGAAAVPVPESPVAVNPYQAELAHFLDCLDAGRKPDITGEDGRGAVRIALAALESIRTGKPVDVHAGGGSK